MAASRRWLLLFACAALAGCSRELSLPPPPSGPIGLSVSPDAAFAGAWLEVHAVGLSTDPRRNEVLFAGGAVAQGEGVFGEVLRVRVPADATSGPIAVRTDAGRSTPFGAFTFLGPGHPVRGSLTRLPLLHEFTDATTVQVPSTSTRRASARSCRSEATASTSPRRRGRSSALRRNRGSSSPRRTY